MAGLTNDIVSTERLETGILAGLTVGTAFLVLHGALGSTFRQWGPRPTKVCKELQRKSFHMIGGCLICAAYHWGIKHEYLTSAYLAESRDYNSGQRRPMDGASAFVAICFVSWTLEASRLLFESVQKWYLRSFKGLIREKENNKAAGIAYFLPGSLAAMLAGPENLAVLGILFLSIGDAAASIGTAAGSLRVGSSSRMWEGSIGCFVVCTALAVYVGLALDVALVTALLVTAGELLAEVIGLDDNLVIPMLGVMGVRIALAPQLPEMAAIMAVGLGIGV
eukprot:CAMPEP_0195083988 /NCGR_PEP_ID=MMETSP0448-20130528/24774_1 /TAXON_ID=66468 /ORGANISM="Heterocapsa triquestra, Strain CCMP 448" /LENGTH=278 /DNA_ID=CAMNT_0040117251 /DNA_START=43 /DNA_END=875 /DNA_ORIENTATION=-